MSDDPQKAINSQMQQEVDDDRDNQRNDQSMTAVSAGTGHDAAKWSIKRIGNRDYESDKARAAAGSQQRQHKSQAQQRIKHEEYVVDNLRDASCGAAARDFAFCLNHFIDGLGAEFARQCIDALCFTWRRLRGVLGNVRVHFAFDLRLDCFMLTGAARFFDRKFIVVHFFPLVGE